MDSDTVPGGGGAPAAGSGPDRPDISLERGGLGCVEASNVSVRLGGIGALRAQRVTVERGGIGAALAGAIHVHQGAVQAVLARDVRLEQAFARSVVAGRVEMGRSSLAGLVIAGRVDGDVRPIIDWRGALALGGAFLLARLLFRRH